MTDPVWKVLVDLNGDGDFSDASEDITSAVVSVDWQLGFIDALDVISRDETCKLVVDNSDQRFSPDSVSALAGLKPGTHLRITVSHDAISDQQMFNTRILSIDTDPDSFGSRMTTIKTEGYMKRAGREEVSIPVQLGKRCDEIVETLLSFSTVQPQVVPGYWQLGVSGKSELGQTTTLGQITGGSILTAQQGSRIFAFAGDNWVSGVTLRRALTDIVGREYGKLWITREGSLKLVNRYNFIEDYVVDETITEDMIVGMPYSFGSKLINTVTARSQPRTVGSSPETLATIDNSIEIPAGMSKEVSLVLKTTSEGARISGQDFIVPIPATDYTVNTESNGTGIDVTTEVSCELISAGASQVKLRFINSYNQIVYVQPGSGIRGTKITRWSEIISKITNEDSVYLYHRAEYSFPYIQDNERDARGMAEYISDSLGEPIGIVQGINLNPRQSDALTQIVLNNPIGNRIALSEAQTNVGGEWFIIGEKHSLTDGTYKWSMSYILMSADVNRYWLLGVSGYGELGETTWLGPL